MKIWALVRTRQKITRDVVMEFKCERPSDESVWAEVIGELCGRLELSRPVILQKHIMQLTQFSRAIFLPDDFLERVHFDRFEMEIFPEEENKPLYWD